MTIDMTAAIALVTMNVSIIGLLLRNEYRITKIETKVDILLSSKEVK